MIRGIRQVGQIVDRLGLQIAWAIWHGPWRGLDNQWVSCVHGKLAHYLRKARGSIRSSGPVSVGYSICMVFCWMTNCIVAQFELPDSW
jgi:hypothetical protein